MATYDAFLPIDRRAALTGGYTLPDRTSGAALFADISGFTPLAAALADQLGALRGAEELTRRLDRVFGALTAQVHAYHGSVIGFSGDAITCWFDGDDGRRATTAALAMQDVIAGLDLPDSAGAAQPVGIKVAVAAGPARRFLVGDNAVRFVEVLAGSILDQTAEGEKLASQGEVIVTAAVRQALGDDLLIHATKKDADSRPFFVVQSLNSLAEADPWPAFPPLPTELTRQWIMQPVFQRLELGKGQFVSELRPATAVFIKFAGIDYDGDEKAGQKLDTFVCWVQSILDRYGASLEQITLGDKGSYMLLVFGAPIAHEDDAAHALSAALELRTPPAYLNYITDIQIGVNRGRMHAGAYGGSERVTYGILGEATNTAARLMEQARPGEVLTTASLAAVTADRFEFQAHAPVRLKGMAEPMSLATLDCRRGERVIAQPQAAGGIIGRAAEKEALAEALQKLAAGENQILIIEGEAGIGKSMMVAELQANARQQGFETMLGAGDAIEQSSPYFAWRRIVRAALNLEYPAEVSGAALDETVSARLAVIDPELVRLAPLLGAVLPLTLAENDVTATMAGEVRADNLHRLLAAVLNAQAVHKPLVVILEDGHWLDSASWALARVVARSVTPLLLVIATRPLRRPIPDYTFLQQLPDSRHLLLDSMAPEEVLAIAQRRLGVSSLPEPVARLVLEKAEGHPFFGEELAYALRDAGHIHIENGHAELVTDPEALASLTFPDTIQGVITSRIDAVSARQQLILKVASVIGRVFAYEVLHDVDPVREDDQELRTDLETLATLDITPLESPEPELAYLFRHIITQEVAYGLLTFAQRKELHRLIAEWYESHQDMDLEAVYPLLAFHYMAAETPAKSIPYSLKAGRRALENGAFREAVKHFTDGLNLNATATVIRDPAELAEWYFLKGMAHRNIGELDQSFESLFKALDLLGEPYPSGQARFSASLAGQVTRQLAHRAAPGIFDGRDRGQGHTLLVAGIYEVLQAIFFFQNQMMASVYSILRHLNLSEEAPPSAQRARSYAAMVNAVGVAGLHKQVPTYIRLAEDILDLDIPQPDQGLVFQYLAIYYAGAAQWAANESNCLRAIDIATAIGNRRRWQENVSCLALALLARGEVERSTQLRQDVYAAAAQDEDRQIQVWGLLELAEIALLRGEAAEAERFLHRAEAIWESFGLTEEIWLHGLLGVALLRQGKTSAAQDAVDRARTATAAAPPSAFYLLEAISGMAEVDMASWQAAPDAPDLKKRAQETVNLLKSFARSFPFSKPRSLLWAGLFAAYNGRGEQATKLWLDGVESARALQMPYDEGLLLLELAARGQLDTARREQYLAAAGEIFGSLGAAHDLQRMAG